MLIGELFGTSYHKVMKSISSSGRTIFIDFKKQFGSIVYNYQHSTELVASIKYNRVYSDCQSWLNNTMLISPNNPNINCSWIITRKFGSYVILDFRFIEVKPMNITIKML